MVRTGMERHTHGGERGVGGWPDFSSSLFSALEHPTNPTRLIFAEDRTWKGRPGGEFGLIYYCSLGEDAWVVSVLGSSPRT